MFVIKNLTKKFKDRILFENINLILPDTGLFIIKGRSGEGKTTLLNILSLLEDEYQGEIYFNGKEYKNIKNKVSFRFNNFAYIFQHFYLFDNLTAENNINFFSNSNDPNEININIPLNKKVKNLSGGEKQKVAILRAIKNNPKVLFCDEPTGSLDKKSKQNIASYLKKISKRMLVIVVTHEEDYFKDMDGLFQLKDKSLVKIYQKRIDKDVKNDNVHIKNKISFKTKINYIFKNLKASINRTIIAITAIGIGLFSISISLMLPNIVLYEIKNELISEFDNNKLLAKENESSEFYETFSCSEREINHLCNKYIQDIDGYGTYYCSNFEEQFKDKNHLNITIENQEISLPNFTIRHINEYLLFDELNMIGLEFEELKDDECYFVFTKRDIKRLLDFSSLDSEEKLKEFIKNEKIRFKFTFANDSWDYEKEIQIKCKGYIVGDSSRVVHTSKRWNEYIFEKQMKLEISDNLVSNDVLPWTLKKMFYLKCKADNQIEVIKKLWSDSSNNSYLFDLINENNSKLIHGDNIKFSRIFVTYQERESFDIGGVEDFFVDQKIESLLYLNSKTYYVFDELMFNSFTSATFLFSNLKKMNNFIDEYTLCEENLNAISKLDNDDIVYGNLAAMTEDDNLKIRNNNALELYGRYANNYQEIVISKKIADTLFKGISYENILMKELYFLTIKDYLYDGILYENDFINVPLKIVGIDLKNDKWNNLYVDSYWSSLFYYDSFSYSLNELRPQKCLIDLNGKNKEIIFNDYRNNSASFLLVDPLKNLNNNIEEVLRYVNYGLIGFSSISIISAVLMNIVVVYLFIKDQEKEIGLMRIVGASKISIFSLFIILSFIIGFGAFLYADLMLIIVIGIIDSSMLLNFEILGAVGISICTLFIISLFISLLIGGLSSLISINKNPIKLINNDLN